MQPKELLCAYPDCGFDFTHFLKEPEFHYVGDEYDFSKGLTTRGNWLEVQYYCEKCDRISMMVLAFHKGQIVMHIRPLDKKYEGGYPDVDRSSERPKVKGGMTPRA